MKLTPRHAHFTALLLALVAGTAAAAPAATAERPAWHLEAWRSRVAVQVINPTDDEVAAMPLATPALPLRLWANEGKLQREARDLALVGGEGEAVAFALVAGELGDAQLLLSVPPLPPRGRATYWLYYGNAAAAGEPPRPADTAPPETPLRATLGAEETLRPLERPATPVLEAWLARHRHDQPTDAYVPDPRDFEGRVWMRWRLDRPAELAYVASVENDLHPYSLRAETTGPVGRFGLGDDAPILAGEYSAWVLLPTSGAQHWNSVLHLRAAGAPFPAGAAVRLEFANRPDAARLFHLADEPLSPSAGGPAVNAAVRMPTDTRLESLAMVETFTQWSQRRLAMARQVAPGDPPRLTKLRVGTWAYLGTTPSRKGGGEVDKDRAKADFEVLERIGVNMWSGGGIDGATFAELAEEHGIIDTTHTAWAGMWAYTHEARSGEYAFRGAETPEQRWKRVFDHFYRDGGAPPLASHINLGDEIGPATTAAEIADTPQILADFQAYLRDAGLTPAALGAADWKQVQPTADRAALEAPGASVEFARRFYHTRRYIDHYTTMHYRLATEAARRAFPHAHSIVVNYQAGPFQFGFMGNNNDLAGSPMDIFGYARGGAFDGVMMEDWVNGATDWGIGFDCLGAQIIYAAARQKPRLQDGRPMPTISYLVGGEAIDREFYAYLMHGVKENALYLYGPVTTIGPAWAESRDALAATAAVTRDAKKFEDLLVAALPRRPRAAMLIAQTSDIMQVHGTYFGPERQQLYIALQHAYVPLDLLCEQEIFDDEALDDYQVLYVSDPQVRRDVQATIAAWVRRGGHLWAGLGAAGWDEYNQPCDLLDEALGVQRRAMVRQENWPRSTRQFWQTVLRRFAFEQVGSIDATAGLIGPQRPESAVLEAWGARLDAQPTTAEVIATYGDGRPAVLVNQFGRGRAMLVGALVGEGYARQHYARRPGEEGWSHRAGAAVHPFVLQPLIDAGVAPAAELSVPGFYIAVQDTEEATIVFINGVTPAGSGEGELVLRVRHPRGTRVVESARHGVLEAQRDGDAAVIQLPWPPPPHYLDMIVLRK